MTEDKGISRRDFLKGAATGVLVGSLGLPQRSENRRLNPIEKKWIDSVNNARENFGYSTTLHSAEFLSKNPNVPFPIANLTVRILYGDHEWGRILAAGKIGDLDENNGFRKLAVPLCEYLTKPLSEKDTEDFYMVLVDRGGNDELKDQSVILFVPENLQDSRFAVEISLSTIVEANQGPSNDLSGITRESIIYRHFETPLWPSQKNPPHQPQPIPPIIPPQTV